MQHFAGGIAEAQIAVVQLQRAVGLDEAHVIGIEAGKVLDLREVCLVVALEQVERELRVAERLGQALENFVALRGGERLVYAAGHREIRVNLTAGDELDEFLAELAQPHALDGNVGLLLDEANDVADGRVGIEPEQQVGRAEMEEAERVGLYDLAHVHQFAQHLRRLRNLAADDGVAGLGAGEQMADRADAAGARGDLGHLGEMPAFAELFKTAELHDVETRVVHLAPAVEMDGDLGVALDAGHGVDGDGLGCHVSRTSNSSQSTAASGRPAIP